VGLATGGSLGKYVQGQPLPSKQPALGNRVKVFPNTMRTLLAARSPIYLILTTKIRSENRTVGIYKVNYKIHNQLLASNFLDFSPKAWYFFWVAISTVRKVCFLAKLHLTTTRESF
jgi:hypothetical protein